MFKEVFVICILLIGFVYCGWIPQYSGTTANLNDVFFFNDTLTGYICGDSGIILKTTNSGNDWIRQTTPVTTKLNAIYFIGDTGWCVGNDGTLLMTNNGGLTWQGYTSPSANLYDVWFFNSYVGVVIGDSGAIFKTNNGARTWFLVGLSINAALRSMFFINNHLGWVVGDQGRILKTQNQGSTWSLEPTAITNTLRGICFIDSLRGYAIGDYGTILINMGLGWYQINSPTRVNLFSIDLEDRDTGYICGDSGIVFSFTFGLDTINPLIALFSINFPTSKVGWTVGSNGSIYKTSDGGAMIEEVNKKESRSLFITPNPFTDDLIVKISFNKGTTRLKIYNALGKVIIDKDVKNGLLRLNGKSLAKGVYFIKAKNTITQVIKI